MRAPGGGVGPSVSSWCAPKNQLLLFGFFWHLTSSGENILQFRFYCCITNYSICFCVLSICQFVFIVKVINMGSTFFITFIFFVFPPAHNLLIRLISPRFPHVYKVDCYSRLCSQCQGLFFLPRDKHRIFCILIISIGLEGMFAVRSAAFWLTVINTVHANQPVSSLNTVHSYLSALLQRMNRSLLQLVKVFPLWF